MVTSNLRQQRPSRRQHNQTVRASRIYQGAALFARPEAAGRLPGDIGFTGPTGTPCRNALRLLTTKPGKHEHEPGRRYLAARCGLSDYWEWRTECWGTPHGGKLVAPALPG